jgi:hypothetical protein
MVREILLFHIDLGSFLKVSAMGIVLAIFVSATMSSIMVIRTLGSLATSIRLFGLFFPSMLVLVFLPMLIDYFNEYAHTCILGIVAQIKNMG